MFEVIQTPTAIAHLNRTLIEVRSKFNIDWLQVKWRDLTKPLYSAIGARLYLQYQSRNNRNGIPQATVDQAQFWVDFYRPSGSTDYFTQLIDSLGNGKF